MCVQCLPCPKAPAGSSMAVPSPGWWEQAPHQHPLPGRRLSVALLCNCRWLLDRSRLHMVFNLSFYTCPIRRGGRRRRGGDRRWRRLGWSAHRDIRRGGRGGRGGRGRGRESTTGTSAGPWSTECRGRAPGWTHSSSSAGCPSWSGKCLYCPTALPAMLSTPGTARKCSHVLWAP